LQWLKIRLSIFIVGAKAIFWAYKKGYNLPFKEYPNMLSWKSWSSYKQNHHYQMKVGNEFLLIRGSDLNDFLTSKLINFAKESQPKRNSRVHGISEINDR